MIRHVRVKHRTKPKLCIPIILAFAQYVGVALGFVIPLRDFHICSNYAPSKLTERNQKLSVTRSPNEDGTAVPLFNVPVDDSNNSFRVKDVSSLQEFEYDGDLDNKESEEHFSNVDYQVDESLAIDDTEENNLSRKLYTRDDDDILTEREDRLYIDESGRRRKVETCVLVGVEELTAMRRDRRKFQASENPEELGVQFSLEESMTEMRDLIKTSGLELVGEITQRLNKINPKTYIGSGKVKETQEFLNELECCTVVFDAELTPGQQKALENSFNKEVIQNDFLGADQIGEVKVLDRTALILDIFAQHAKTREGKLQVDLALHVYRKPRLTKMWTHLERQSGAGGVGLRGPGESQLEIDKRLLRDRINVLQKKINAVQTQRDIHRKGRSRMGLPTLALVGYTNSGKSTMLNHLTRAGVMAESMLFATVDPTTRKVKLPGLKTHPEVLLTDTVGFIQKLPTQLVAAFRATLEEVIEADVLVHIMDVNNPVWEKQEVAVKQVLSEIGAGDKPIVRVFNKIDMLDNDVAEDLQYEAVMMPGYAVATSALTGTGMVDFVAAVEDALKDLLVPIEVLLPYCNGKEVNMIQEVGHVENIEYKVEGTYLQARVPVAVANRLTHFNVDGENSINLTDASASEDGIDWVVTKRDRHLLED